MEWTAYPYTVRWEDDAFVKKPRVEVTFTKNGNSFSCAALVDSGSDVTLISSDVAEFLNIDLSDCKRHTVTGIVGGSAPAYLCEVELRVEKFQDSPLRIEVVFVPGLHAEALLGQYSFFQNFKVRFEKDIDTFYLARAPRPKQ